MHLHSRHHGTRQKLEGGSRPKHNVSKSDMVPGEFGNTMTTTSLATILHFSPQRGLKFVELCMNLRGAYAPNLIRPVCNQFCLFSSYPAYPSQRIRKVHLNKR